MSFIEPSTSRAYDIVKSDGRNRVAPLNGDPSMDAEEARRQGWSEAAKVVEAFDAIDGRAPHSGGMDVVTTIMDAKL